jgi:transcriptional regulator with PAS, ATPase and Fis domain
MEKQTITFITRHDHTLRAFIRQCYDLGMMEEFNVEGRTVGQLACLPICSSSLIVTSSDVIVPVIKPYLANDAKIIVAQRTINFTNIRDVLEIPCGMKVLLVNDFKERAIETINLLKNSGIDLDFYPFYPGATTYPQDIMIAVTPGEIKLVPPTIPKVIDIGSRVIDLATWLEIYAYFNYEILDLPTVTSKYVHSAVTNTKELNNVLQQTNFWRRYLSVIVDQLEAAVLAIDKDSAIQIINPKALEILQLQDKNIIKQKAADCLQSDFYQLICRLPYETEEVMNWGQQTFFFRKRRIIIEGKNFGCLILFRKAAEINKLEHDYRRQQSGKGFVANYTFPDLIGTSSLFKKLVTISQNMAKSESTILLLGETGTGKELLAQAIHNASLRSSEPFVRVNFSAFSETLLESELFGSEAGTITGENRSAPMGLFEQAHKGTIFLDEIGNASAMIQNRLLRVLQEREIIKVKGKDSIPLDFRVIAATSHNLEKMVGQGLFRADLYYRLNVLPLYLPALRERRQDIPLLMEAFIKKNCRELKRPIFQFSQSAMAAMIDYHWPGNIRELENLIQYLGHIVDDVVLPEHLLFKSVKTTAPEAADSMGKELEDLYQTYANKGFVQEIKLVLQTMEHAQTAVGRNYVCNQMKIAGLNITEQQLRYRMQLLKRGQLIVVGRGRQGSSVSKKGLAFIKYLKCK